MHIMIIGAAGMIGDKLTRAIERQALQFSSSPPSSAGVHLTLVDMAEPHFIAYESSNLTVEKRVADFTNAEVVRSLSALRPDIIYHLAAVVSGEAEADFTKGYDVNVRASWALFEGLRTEAEKSGGGYCPRVIFSSSLAVYGPPFPFVVEESHVLSPASSYGAQKAMVELLISDYSRKGFFEGMSVRLPTIVVRPGKPNAAASSFLSSIIREPLAGETTVLPVSGDAVVWVSSPAVAIENLIKAGLVASDALKGHSIINLPGLKVSIREMIEGLVEVGGAQLTSLILPQRDETIEKIVLSWPSEFETQTATALGMQGDNDFVSIVRAHAEASV